MSAMASQITVRSTACHDSEQKKHSHIFIVSENICNTEIAFWNIVIIVAPHERHDFSNHRLIDFLFHFIS